MYFWVWSGLEQQDLVVLEQQDLVVPEQQDLVVLEQQDLVVDQTRADQTQKYIIFPLFWHE